MTRRNLPLGMTLFCLSCVILFFSLGTWQLSRMEWKEQLIATLESARQKAPVILSAFHDVSGAGNELEHKEGILFTPCCTSECKEFCDRPGSDPNDYLYRDVALSGWFEHEHELFIPGRYRGSEFGYHLITPFTLSYGPTILVVRGWIPNDRKDPATRKEGQILTIDKEESGTVIEGVLIPSEKAPAWFLPQHRPEQHEWFTYDLPAIAAWLKQHSALRVRPLLLLQTNKRHAGEYPAPLSFEPGYLNDHLEYAITWYSLAGLTLLMYILFLRKTRNQPLLPPGEGRDEGD